MDWYLNLSTAVQVIFFPIALWISVQIFVLIGAIGTIILAKLIELFPLLHGFWKALDTSCKMIFYTVPKGLMRDKDPMDFGLC